MSTSPSSPQDPRPGPLPAAWLDLVVDPLPGEGAGEDEAVRGAEELLGRPPTDVEWAALRSARGHVRALRFLERLGAPATLEGSVVASLEAGHRQARATAVVTAMDRLRAPAELDAWFAETIDRAAPAVLDQMVKERISAPEASTVQSMTGHLGRKPAPTSLDERVLGGGPLTVGGIRMPRMATRLLASAVVALTLIVAIRLAGEDSLEVEDSDRLSAGIQITIRRVDSADAAGLSDADRMFLSSLTGQTFGGRS